MLLIKLFGGYWGIVGEFSGEQAVISWSFQDHLTILNIRSILIINNALSNVQERQA
jgi:hypothetical protein